MERKRDVVGQLPQYQTRLFIRTNSTHPHVGTLGPESQVGLGGSILLMVCFVLPPKAMAHLLFLQLCGGSFEKV